MTKRQASCFGLTFEMFKLHPKCGTAVKFTILKTSFSMVDLTFYTRFLCSFFHFFRAHDLLPNCFVFIDVSNEVGNKCRKVEMLKGYPKEKGVS